MTYFRLLLYCSKHIISVFLITVFLFKGIASLLPALSFSFKVSAVEFVTDAETENTGKERSEKECKKEFTAEEGFTLHASAATGIFLKQTKALRAGYKQNIFFPVFTPPPNFS